MRDSGDRVGFSEYVSYVNGFHVEFLKVSLPRALR
jgi:hypothetical protein